MSRVEADERESEAWPSAEERCTRTGHCCRPGEHRGFPQLRGGGEDTDAQAGHSKPAGNPCIPADAPGS